MHPKYFKPDPEIFNHLGIKKGEKFALIRFVSWNASHDVGQKGISIQIKRDLIRLLAARMHVFISSEGELPAEFQPYKIKILPHQMHDVLAFAGIFIGEGATMASEAGLLGTPSFYINSIKACNNFDQEKYGTVFNFNDETGLLEKIRMVLELNDAKSIWNQKSARIFEEKINVTEFLVWLVENYPESIQILKNNPDYPDKFK